LEKRLRNRGTDDEESLQKRIRKAEYELSFAPQFDLQVINDDLEKALQETMIRITEFLNR